MGTPVDSGGVGPSVVTDTASPTPLRSGRTRELITGDAHARYREAASRQKLFVASIGVAGVAPGTALSTTPALSLWNPAGSGVRLDVIEVCCAYVSGTIGAGQIVFAFLNSSQQTTAPTGGTALTPVACDLSAVTGKAKAFTGSTLTATPTIVKPAFNLNPTLATAPAAGGFSPATPASYEVAGLFSIAPGALLCLAGITAAGSTPLVTLAITYEEVDL